MVKNNPEIENYEVVYARDDEGNQLPVGNLFTFDSSVGQNQRSVGSYGKSLLNFAGQLGLVTGGIALLKKGFDIGII